MNETTRNRLTQDAIDGCLWGCLSIILIVFVPVVAAVYLMS